MLEQACCLIQQHGLAKSDWPDRPGQESTLHRSLHCKQCTGELCCVTEDIVLAGVVLRTATRQAHIP